MARAAVKAESALDACDFGARRETMSAARGRGFAHKRFRLHATSG